MSDEKTTKSDAKTTKPDEKTRNSDEKSGKFDEKSGKPKVVPETDIASAPQTWNAGNVYQRKENDHRLWQILTLQVGSH